MRARENAPDGLQPSEALDEAHSLPGRVDRYGKAKSRATEMVAYLRSIGLESLKTGTVEPGSRRDPGFQALKLSGCGNWLKFRSYFTVGKVRLTAASFCKEHLLCPLCAIRRGGKAMQRYVERARIIMQADPELRPFLVTLTIQNRDDLMSAYAHLTECFVRLMKRRHEKRAKSSLADIAGAIASLEVTNIGNGWHPHIHMLVLARQIPSETMLAAEWESITGDSYIVDVRPVENMLGGFCEVLKYAVKLSDLRPDLTWHAFNVLANRRLLSSFGVFRDVQEPDELVDETADLDALPYVEMLYRYSFHARAFSLQRISEVITPAPAQVTP